MNTYHITVTRNIKGSLESEQFEFITHLKSNEAVLVKQLMKALTSYYIASSRGSLENKTIEKIIAQSLALHNPEVLFTEAREKLNIVDCVVKSSLDPIPARLHDMASEMGLVATA